MSDTIKKLADLFSQFPTIGSRTASRFVFYLIKLPKEKIDELTNTIQGLKSKIKFCSFCLQPFESSNQEALCQICASSSRNRQLLCVVEKEADLISIESKKKYNGLYFILGRAWTLKRNVSGENLRIQELKERVANPQKFNLSNVEFKELIIATNPTPEGKTISLLVERALKEITSPVFKITHLARGIPVGGELEYIDEETLESAFEGRK